MAVGQCRSTTSWKTPQRLKFPAGQIWQWLHHKADVVAAGGAVRTFSQDWFGEILAEELAAIREAIGAEAYEQGRYELAAKIFTDTATGEDLPDFLTLPAYEALRQFD